MWQERWDRFYYEIVISIVPLDLISSPELRSGSFAWIYLFIINPLISHKKQFFSKWLKVKNKTPINL